LESFLLFLSGKHHNTTEDERERSKPPERNVETEDSAPKKDGKNKKPQGMEKSLAP